MNPYKEINTVLDELEEVKSTKENLKQERIWYKDVIELGFEEIEQHDDIYFNEHGYDYSIVQLKLTEFIYLDWSKSTGLCTLIRIDSEYNIKAKLPILDIEHLKEIIEFFIDDES